MIIVRISESVMDAYYYIEFVTGYEIRTEEIKKKLFLVNGVRAIESAISLKYNEFSKENRIQL